MQLTQLKHFVTIADLGSMSKAARELNISQPSLTASIKQLEDEMGQAVFVRTSKGVFLTNYGKSIYQSVVRILSEVEAIKPSPQEKRPISICMVNISNRILELAAEYAAQTPDCRFNIACRSLSAGKNERFDFYVCDRPPNEFRPYRGIPIPTEHLFAVVPKGSDLAGREKIAPLDLKDQLFVFSAFRDMKNMEPSYYECIESGFTPKIAAATDALHEKMALLSTGRFVGIITGSWYDAYKRMSAVEVIPLTKWSYSMRTLSLFYTINAVERSPMAHGFADYVQEHLLSGYPM